MKSQQKRPTIQANADPIDNPDLKSGINFGQREQDGRSSQVIKSIGNIGPGRANFHSDQVVKIIDRALGEQLLRVSDVNAKDLYIINTARKMGGEALPGGSRRLFVSRKQTR